MTDSFNPELDLQISRLIKAPVPVVWAAWADRALFEKWWIPAPSRCRVVEMDLRPGGSLLTEISEGGAPFGPHLRACFLDIAEGRRIVFTNALVGGWRPAEQPFMTAIITMTEVAAGTEYHARVMHRNQADRDMHMEMGFNDGWGTVQDQLAALVEK